MAVDRPEPDPEMLAALQSQIQNLQSKIENPPDLPSLPSAFQSAATTFTIHPGVAETVRAAADGPVLDAADIALGNYHKAMFMHGLKTEMQGGGRMVVDSARRAAPYLLRQSRWAEAVTLLERIVHPGPSQATLSLPCRCCGGSRRPQQRRTWAENRRRPGQCVAAAAARTRRS